MSLSHSLASGYVIGMWDDEGNPAITDGEFALLADAEAELDTTFYWTDHTNATLRDKGAVIFALVPLGLFRAAESDTPLAALVKLAEVHVRLEDVYTDEGLAIWDRSANRNLGGRSPWELAVAGEFVALDVEVDRLCGDGNVT